MNSVISALNKKNVLRFVIVTMLILAMTFTTTSVLFADEDGECTCGRTNNDRNPKDGICDYCNECLEHSDLNGDDVCDTCKDYLGVEPGDAVGAVLGIVFTLVQYAGIVMLVFGIVILTLALRNEDADSKNRAILYIISAAAMIALKSLTGVLLDALGVDITLG